MTKWIPSSNETMHVPDSLIHSTTDDTVLGTSACKALQNRPAVDAEPDLDDVCGLCLKTTEGRAYAIAAGLEPDEPDEPDEGEE